MLAVVGLAIGIAALSDWPSGVETAGNADLVGRASVIDGDTIRLGSERVRLSGIDAPELQQMCRNAMDRPYRCGADSAAALGRFMLEALPIRCRREGRDDYGRVVAQCFRADGRGLAEFLVGNGHAIDWPQFSGGAYARHQRDAQARKLGVWAGRFEEPWAWRSAQR